MIYRNKVNNVIFLNYPIKKVKGKWIPCSKGDMPVPEVIDEKYIYFNISRPFRGDVEGLASYDQVRIWHSKWKNELSSVTCMEAVLVNHPLGTSSILVTVTKILEGPCPQITRKEVVEQQTVMEQIQYSNIICIEIIRKFRLLLEKLINKRVVLVRYRGKKKWLLDSIEVDSASRPYLSQAGDHVDEFIPEEVRALRKNGEGRISRERYKNSYNRWKQEVIDTKEILKRIKRDYLERRASLQTLKQKKPAYIQPRVYVPNATYSNIESYTFERYILTIKSKRLHIDGYGVYPPITVKVDYYLASINVTGFHPHVNGSGNPCFGQEINIGAIIESMNIDWMLTFLNNWLVSYNPNSPWRSLAVYVPCKGCGDVVVHTGINTLSVVRDEESYYFCSDKCLNEWEKSNDKSKSTGSGETPVLASPSER